MAERKAVNKYYPPDWDPRKGSANKRVGQHPLRDRAKKLSQGILVIRFELPYNIWCGGCGSHIGMGVRYNAEKSKVGNYYTTPIYKFRMKCHLCDNYFEIQTDPKNHDYVILSGARRKEQRWDPVANEQVVPEDKATQKKLATDPMYKLEHGSDDHQRGKDKVMSLAQIEESRVSMLDDYNLNRKARDMFRTEKKQMKDAAEADRAILERASLNIDLVEESEEDRKLAGLMKYSVTSSYEEKQMEKRKIIELRPIFNTEDSLVPTSLSLSSSPSSSDVSPNQKQIPAAVNQQGDLKSKLSRVLKATFKDPFKSGGKKIFGKSSELSKMCFSKPNHSRLGIKLKSSNGSTFATPKVLQKKTKSDKTDVVIKCCQQKDVSSGESSHSEPLLMSNVTSSRSSISDSTTVVNPVSEVIDNYNSADSTELSDSSNLVFTHEKASVSPESLSLSLVAENTSGCNQPKDELKSNSSHDQHCTEKAEQTNTSTNKFDLNENTTGNALNISNTSLQALMCSYTDSDSE